jgi:hypothetical protein
LYLWEGACFVCWFLLDATSVHIIGQIACFLLLCSLDFQARAGRFVWLIAAAAANSAADSAADAAVAGCQYLQSPRAWTETLHLLHLHLHLHRSCWSLWSFVLGRFGWLWLEA